MTDSVTDSVTVTLRTCRKRERLVTSLSLFRCLMYQLQKCPCHDSYVSVGGTWLPNSAGALSTAEDLSGCNILIVLDGRVVIADAGVIVIVGSMLRGEMINIVTTTIVHRDHKRTFIPTNILLLLLHLFLPVTSTRLTLIIYAPGAVGRRFHTLYDGYASKRETRTGE